MRLGGLQKILKVISIPIAAQITILPIMIKNFNTISLTFLFSNIIAMPLLGICIIGGYLITFLSFIWLGLAQKIGIIFNLILKILILTAKFFANLKLSNIYVVTPSTITIIIYYFIVFGGISILKILQIKGAIMRPYIRKYLQEIDYKKTLLIFLMLIIIIEFPYSNYDGKLKIYFIDVGQRR